MAALPLANPREILNEANYILKLSVGLENLGLSLNDTCSICWAPFSHTTFFGPEEENPNFVSQSNPLVSCGCPGTHNQHIFHTNCLNQHIKNRSPNALCPFCSCELKRNLICKITNRTTSKTCDNSSGELLTTTIKSAKAILNEKTQPLLQQIEAKCHQAEVQIRQQEEYADDARLTRIRRAQTEARAPPPEPERQRSLIPNFLRPLNRPVTSARERFNSFNTVRPYGGKKSKKKRKTKRKN
jgi:hypothetical protein